MAEATGIPRMTVEIQIMERFFLSPVGYEDHDKTKDESKHSKNEKGDDVFPNEFLAVKVNSDSNSLVR
jgi:hypothetical protein